jgi:PIN domain nuclease of toxin-antitoxin system
VKVVLDASAVLALTNGEPGSARVREVVSAALVSAVNYAEVGARLCDLGANPAHVSAQLRVLGFSVVPFDDAAAEEAIRLRDVTRHAGLSLADRACLALAIREGAVAVTADRTWSTLEVGCEIELIR